MQQLTVSHTLSLPLSFISMTQRLDQTSDSSMSMSNDIIAHRSSLSHLSPPHAKPPSPSLPPSATCNHTGSHSPTPPINGPLRPSKLISETVNSTRGCVTSTPTPLGTLGKDHCPPQPQRSRKRSRDLLSPSSEAEHHLSFDTTHLVRKKMRTSKTDFMGGDQVIHGDRVAGGASTDGASSDNGPALNLRQRVPSSNKSVRS